MARNRSSKRLRKILFERENGLCFYCGIKMKMICPNRSLHMMTIEHIIPKSLGGQKNERNCVAACKCCNELRGNRRIVEFIMSRGKDWMPSKHG